MRATVESPVLATGPVDGRSARRDRNKTAVLDAVLELFQEGSLSPGPVEVAQRCGLSPRSVYRYFDDADELVRAAVDRHLELTLPYFHLSAIGQGPRDERIDRFAERRFEGASGRTDLGREIFGLASEVKAEAEHQFAD